MSGLLNGFSYKEKSILISLVAVTGLYGAYFFRVISGETEPTLGAMLTSMIGIVVALVVVHVIYHVVISLDDVPQAEDERDRAVSRRASVVGYNVLFVTIILITGRMLVTGAWAEAADGSAPSHFEIANLLLAALVLSEAVYYAAQLVLYRRGVHG